MVGRQWGWWWKRNGWGNCGQRLIRETRLTVISDAQPALCGDVTMISHPSVGPLDTVTAKPSPMMAPASPRPKPNLGQTSLARHRADSNSSPMSVMDAVCHKELLRLGAITSLQDRWCCFCCSSSSSSSSMRSNAGSVAPSERQGEPPTMDGWQDDGQQEAGAEVIG